ncbi:MAG: septum formation family protein [Micrococcales bacterium]|nr:septum formation family protein [Micrococcales bacterium]OJX67659.1 MAG: hypothetical protein BGO94_02230 [Micrococcales bacterium 72-143]
MNDGPRDDDEQSARDWLAAQFGGEERVDAAPAEVTPARAPDPPPGVVNPLGAVPPAQPQPQPPVPPPSVPPFASEPLSPAAATPDPAQPAAPPASGGFSWGLRPGETPPPAADSQAPVVPEVPPVAASAPVPPPPVAAPVPPLAAAAPQPDVQPPSPPPAASEPPVPPPLVEPAEPTPTVAWTPPPFEPGLDGAAPDGAPPAAPMPFETARLPEVAPDAGDAPSWDVPTQMMDSVPEAAPVAEPSMPPQAAADLAATELLGSAAIAHDASTTSALEALFADENFRDYVADPDPSQAPFARARTETVDPAPASARRGEISRTQKILLGVAGGLVALLALLALFLLGTRLGAIVPASPAPTASGTPSPSPSPSATALPAGPVEPGVWAWDALLGGECLDPFEDAWAEEFTVVDCAEQHPAQLVRRGTIPLAVEGATAEPFPGVDALQTQVQALCGAAGILDYAVAGQVTDLQVQASFPATAEQWDAGDRSYFCFVSRSSGEPLTGSVAVASAPAG